LYGERSRFPDDALNQVFCPIEHLLSADNRLLLETQKAEAEAEVLRLRQEEATTAGKRRLMVDLKEAGVTKITGLEIAQAFGVLGIAHYSLSQHEEILRRLVTHFKPGSPG
jgi:hypothetical protein